MSLWSLSHWTPRKSKASLNNDTSVCNENIDVAVQGKHVSKKDSFKVEPETSNKVVFCLCRNLIPSSKRQLKQTAANSGATSPVSSKTDFCRPIYGQAKQILKQNHLVIAFVYKRQKMKSESVHLLLFIAEVGKLPSSNGQIIYFGALQATGLSQTQ